MSSCYQDVAASLPPSLYSSVYSCLPKMLLTPSSICHCRKHSTPYMFVFAAHLNLTPLLHVSTYMSILSLCIQIHTSLINGRPSADDPSPTLLNFTSARYIRLVFQRIRTLNADLMTLALHDPRDIDPIVTRRVRLNAHVHSTCSF